MLVKAWQGGLLRSALNVAVQPELLQWVGVGIMVGAVLWIGSIVLTAEQSWPRRRRGGRGARVLFAAAACTLIAAPSALAVRYIDVQSSVIDAVFVEDSPGEHRDVALADTAAEDPWADVPRVNTLLIGSDAGKDRWGTRTDSMMVVSTNTKTGDTLLIGIPRNLERVPFPTSNPLHALYPNGYDCGDECLMNGIWTLAESRPDLFPGVDEPRPQGDRRRRRRDHRPRHQPVGRRQPAWLQGARRRHGRGRRQRAAEGVRRVPHLLQRSASSSRGDKSEYIEPGLQHLDGFHALWYSRSRAGSDDFSRMRRQRCVAGALMQQADPVGLLQSYPQLAKVVKNNVSIDIPRDELSGLGRPRAAHPEGRLDPLAAAHGRRRQPGQPGLRRDPRTREEGPEAAGGEPDHRRRRPSPTPTPTRTKKSSTPTPTATPDDSAAESLAATC